MTFYRHPRTRCLLRTQPALTIKPTSSCRHAAERSAIDLVISVLVQYRLHQNDRQNRTKDYAAKLKAKKALVEHTTSSFFSASSWHSIAAPVATSLRVDETSRH